MQSFYQSRTSMLQTTLNDHLTSFPLHLHDSLELVYVTEGSVILNHSGSSYTLVKDDFAIIFPYEIHGYTAVSSTSVSSCLFVICSPDFTGSFKSTLTNSRCDMPVIHNCSSVKNIKDSMYELRNIGSRTALSTDLISDSNTILAKILISLILVRSLSIIEIHKTDFFSKPNLLAKILIYVSQHYCDRISLATIAETFGITPGYVSRLFISKLKISFVDYLHQLRIEFAKSLLVSTDNSVINIAMECGFENLRSFNRVFKSLTDSTPLQYRKNVTVQSQAKFQ